MAHRAPCANNPPVCDVDPATPSAPQRRSFRVSFRASNQEGGKEEHVNNTTSQRYDLSFISCGTHRSDQARGFVTPRSPLYPQNVIPFAGQGAAATESETPWHPSSKSTGREGQEKGKDASPELDYFEKEAGHDAASGALLIYPRKIDNQRRFRILFVGLLLSISTSTQGIHAIFGVLYLQQVYRFNPRQMATVYLSGVAAGMFTLPFGVLYDWFGPRKVVALGSLIASLGHLLFALTFAGHIQLTVANCAVFYAVMCLGCNALNVAALPAVLTHMPRDRGQPTGLLQTFSSLGASVFACLFRGFFNSNFENLMWLMFAVTLAAGAAGTWYLEDAPYVVNRWQQRHVTPRQQLRVFLIRNRYMSQLVPKRRYMMMTVVLVLLNVYLTIQAVCVAYFSADMTTAKLRCIAIGAIVLVLTTLLLVVPLKRIDGLSMQDKQVIEEAKAKEETLRTMQEERYRQRHLQTLREEKRHRREEEEYRESPHHTSEEVANENACCVQKRELGANTPPSRSAHRPARLHWKQSPPLHSSIFDMKSDAKDEAEEIFLSKVDLPFDGVREAPGKESQHRGGLLSEAFGLPLYELAGPERSLVPVYIDDVKNNDEEATHLPGNRNSTHPARDAPMQSSVVDDKKKKQMPEKISSENPFMTVQVDVGCESVPPSVGGTPTGGAETDCVELTRTAPSTHTHPRVETITLCGEVYVMPVYQTTFLESLTYLDLWLMLYTTLCVWGIGLVMTGSWNIQIMVKARYGAMEPKHYVLFSAMCGVSIAGGRVFLGVYERVLQLLRERTGTVVVPTLIYPIASAGLSVGVLLWLALPGDKVLLMAYLVAPFFYGMSTSATFYVIGTIFDSDIGMHYSFCYFGGGIGFVLCYWCSWYLTYEREASPLTLGYCVGARRCMSSAVTVYLVLSISSIFSSYLVHRRYSKLVRGKLAQRRVIVPRIRQMLVACGCCVKGERVVKKEPFEGL